MTVIFWSRTIASIALLTAVSDAESNADVAEIVSSPHNPTGIWLLSDSPSSISNIEGFLTNALAILIR